MASKPFAIILGRYSRHHERSNSGVAAIAVDSFDLKIIDVLQGQGRITNARLAIEVGLSESACFNRVKRLEQDRVIQSYRCIVNPKHFRPSITVFVEVVLESHRSQEQGSFERLCIRTPEIVECNAITGNSDFVLKVLARDMDHYNRIMEGIVEAHGRVRQFFSQIVMRPVKSEPISVVYWALPEEED